LTRHYIRYSTEILLNGETLENCRHGGGGVGGLMFGSSECMLLY